MVERRHRIYESEIPAVQEGLELLLLKLYETREDQDKAEAAWKLMYRLAKKDPGRPKYPEFQWNAIPLFIDYYGPT